MIRFLLIIIIFIIFIISSPPNPFLFHCFLNLSPNFCLLHNQFGRDIGLDFQLVGCQFSWFSLKAGIKFIMLVWCDIFWLIILWISAVISLLSKKAFSESSVGTTCTGGDWIGVLLVIIWLLGLCLNGYFSSEFLQIPLRQNLHSLCGCRNGHFLGSVHEPLFIISRHLSLACMNKQESPNLQNPFFLK